MEVDATLIDHLMNPRNYGILEHPDAQGVGINPDNGEKVIVYLKMNRNEAIAYVEDIRFEAIGCTTTVVAGSMLTEEAKGLSEKGIRNLVDATFAVLDNLPPEEAACSEMVAMGMLAAIDTYAARQKDTQALPLAYVIKQTCTSQRDEER